MKKKDKSQAQEDEEVQEVEGTVMSISSLMLPN